MEATINVKNSGGFDGAEVVQLYIWDPVASITRPVKELKAFQKVFLKKGEQEIKFLISINDLKFYNNEGKHITEPGEFRLFIGTNSRDVKETKFTLK